MIFFSIIFVICLFVICLFSYSGFSPIPYFPTNHKDLDLIIKSFKLTNNQIIYDLGAGTGTVIFAAAKNAKKKKLNTLFVAVEINPILILILYVKQLLHANRKNIKILWGDLFKLAFSHPERSDVIANEVKQSKVKQIASLSRVLGIARNDKQTIQQFNNVTIYLYASPWLLEKIIKNLKLKIKNFSVVSYMYPIKILKKKEKVINGKNSIFIYDLNR